jgi:hypothetical protein
LSSSVERPFQTTPTTAKLSSSVTANRARRISVFERGSVIETSQIKAVAEVIKQVDEKAGRVRHPLQLVKVTDICVVGQFEISASRFNMQFTFGMKV